MKLDRESFDFEYVSDEIMANLRLDQDYPNVFTPYKGPFPACYIFCQTFISVDNFARFCHLFIFFRTTLLLKQILSGIA